MYGLTQERQYCATVGLVERRSGSYDMLRGTELPQVCDVYIGDQ